MAECDETTVKRRSPNCPFSLNGGIGCLPPTCQRDKGCGQSKGATRIEKLDPDKAWKDEELLELYVRKLKEELGDPEMQISNTPITTTLTKRGAAIRDSDLTTGSEPPPGVRTIHSFRNLLREKAQGVGYRPELEKVANVSS